MNLCVCVVVVECVVSGFYLSTISHLGVCGVGSGRVAIGGRRVLGLGCLRGLSVGAGLLLSLWWRVERGHGDQSVALVLLIHWMGLLSLQVQHKFKVTNDNSNLRRQEITKHKCESLISKFRVRVIVQSGGAVLYCLEKVGEKNAK